MKAPSHRSTLLGLAVLVQTLQPAQAVDQSCSSFDRAAAVEAINALRERGALCTAGDAPLSGAALRWNERLAQAANAQASWLALQDTLLHRGPQGQVLAERTREAGYRFARVTENLGHAQGSVAQVLASWTASPAHCANLFDARVTEMALACVPSASGRPVWVMLYARPL